MSRRVHPRICIALISATMFSGCYEGDDSDDNGFDTGFGGSDESSADDPSGAEDPGDGDGDPNPTTSGDGDGDGDPDPTTSGDGDGDPNPTTSGDGDGDPDPTTSGDGDPDPSVPDNAYCAAVANWNPAWVEWELEVLSLVNQARAVGGDCDSEGVFGPSGPLSLAPALTCAARVHSKDMADNNYFNHTNLQGNGPGWRLDQAGYNGNGWGENIAAGYSSPQETVDGWLASDGHCSNMLNPSFGLIGIGYAHSNSSDYGHYWTQNFGG